MMQTFDELAQVALVLDAEGRIGRVNGAWRQRGEGRGLAAPDAWLGIDYAALCRSASGRWIEGATDVARAVEAVVAGRLTGAEVGYACDAPDGTAWFTLAIRSLGPGKGALLIHLDTPDPRFMTDAERLLADTTWRHLLGFETRCAWCSRLARPDGTWHPGEPRRGWPVSDGLCPDCERGLNEELRPLEAGRG